MAGIFGIAGPTGPMDRAAACRTMADALRRRGPDGVGLHDGDDIALGTARNHLLPEDAGDPQPLHAGEFWIAADARLDNRSELLGQLSLSSEVPDARIILEAYRRWGDECPEHLLGDFSFAVWDGPRRRLVCARDHFGVRPLFYALAGSRLVFASEIRGVLASGLVNAAVREQAVAEYLASFVSPGDATLYEGILRLQPGHVLVFEDAAVRTRRYWRLETQGPLPCRDAPERFRALFTQAVRDRLRCSGRVAATLSGGLDSSSVAAVAARLMQEAGTGPLPTVSAVFDSDPSRSERPFIEAVLHAGGFDPQILAMDGVFAPLGHIAAIIEAQGGVAHTQNLELSRVLYHAAAGRGARVLLEGQGGDETVSFGYSRLAELAGRGHYVSLWREVKAIARVSGGFSPRKAFLRQAATHGPLRHAASLRRRLRGGRPEGAAAPAPEPGWINPDLRRRYRLGEAIARQDQEDRAARASDTRHHLHMLTSPFMAHAFETLDHAAAEAGLESRFPFWDRRLVEFAVSLPAHEKLSGGWPRLILRRAMDGILPPEVQWRVGKTDFTPHVLDGIVRHSAPLVDAVLADASSPAASYVDFPAARASWGRLRSDSPEASGEDVRLVFRTIALSVWLDQLDQDRRGRGRIPA